MSVRIMGEVWEMDLPHADKFVLISLADHADHDGENVYPSQSLTAWKTGYSERQVMRIISSLVERGILVQTGGGNGQVIRYRIDTSACAKRPRPARKVRHSPAPNPRQNVTPDKMSPLTNTTTNPRHFVTPTPDILSPPIYKVPVSESSVEPSVCNRETKTLNGGDFAHASVSNEVPTEEIELLALDRAFYAGKFGDEKPYRFNGAAYEKHKPHYRTLHLSGYTAEQVKQASGEMARGDGKFSKLTMVTPLALARDIESFLPSSAPVSKVTGGANRQFSKEDEV